jgi:NAD(P)-dependent dehydrogenase (short-subunit alcohol dehydrogenase family)
MNESVVITGANRGIGLALAKRFAPDNQVYALCRKKSGELKSLNVTIVEGCDIATVEGMARIVQALADIRINILINNAGILRDEQLGRIDAKTIVQQFQINALAPLRLVDQLKSNIVAGGKIAMITSRMGSIADNTSGGRYGYRMSKAALNAASVSLAHDLYPQQISVGIYHPGYVQTDMVGGRGDISTSECADRLYNLIVSQSMECSGQFKHSNGQPLPW